MEKLWVNFKSFTLLPFIHPKFFSSVFIMKNTKLYRKVILNSSQIMVYDCNNNNKKLKASPLRGTSDMEHTPLYLHTHKETHKVQYKKF